MFYRLSYCLGQVHCCRTSTRAHDTEGGRQTCESGATNMSFWFGLFYLNFKKSHPPPCPPYAAGDTQSGAFVVYLSLSLEFSHARKLYKLLPQSHKL